MKIITKSLLFILFAIITINVNSQLPIKFRVDEQSMSTPMSSVEDIFFSHYYYTKPVNINFNGNILNMYYDNNYSFYKNNLIKVGEDISTSQEKYYFVPNNNNSDTIIYIVDYEVKYVQFILPTKKPNGEYIGYTSYRKFIKDESLLTLK